MLQFLALAFLLSSTGAAHPKLEANVSLRCELSGNETTSAIAWSMDNREDMNKYQVHKNTGFYVNNEKKELANLCKANSNKLVCDAHATGWSAPISNAAISPEDPFGPVLDLRWEGFPPTSPSKSSWSIRGSGSISVLTNDTMTIQFELKRNKNAKTTVKIVLDEHNTNDTQNVSSVIYIRDPNGNYTEVERRQGQVLDSKLWVHLTINISSTAGSKVQLQLLRHGMKNPVFNKMLEGTVDLNQSMAMVVDINGYQKRHHYAVRYTRSQNNEFSILLKPGCWRVFHFGPLSAIYSSDNGQNQNKFLPYEPSVHMGFSTSKLTLIGNDSIQHNVSFKVEPWYKSFWAIGDILPCYSTRMRNLSGIPLGKINEVHCTNLLSGVSSKFSKTPFYEVNISTIPEYHEVEVSVIEKSMMENKLWFYITTMLLLFILLIVIVISIKILQYFNICVRNESEPFYRRRGSLLVAMKLESIRKRGNNAVSTQRYAPTPGLAEDRNPEDPDYDMIKMPKDTLPAHVPRVPNDLAPPVPPVRPAYTFEDPQYDKVNDEVYDNFGLDSDVKAKKKEAKCKEVELDGPEYGNFGSVSDKKIQSQAVEDEDPVYGNIVVPIPMKQIVVTADIETPEYGNFGENVPEVQNVKEEPKVTKYGDIQDDPIYGNF